MTQCGREMGQCESFLCEVWYYRLLFQERKGKKNPSHSLSPCFFHSVFLSLFFFRFLNFPRIWFSIFVFLICKTLLDLFVTHEAGHYKIRLFPIKINIRLEGFLFIYKEIVLTYIHAFNLFQRKSSATGIHRMRLRFLVIIC